VTLAPKVVDRKPVSNDEAEMAEKVLASWNEIAEQELRSKDWLAKIIMRLREHPELGLPEHVFIIEAALAHPWWKGEATPSVIYGNGAQFERQLMEAAKGSRSPSQRAFDLAVQAIEDQRRAS
jgi:hypothetical protein